MMEKQEESALRAIILDALRKRDEAIVAEEVARLRKELADTEERAEEAKETLAWTKEHIHEIKQRLLALGAEVEVPAK